ncbi:hypothetical protein EYF80_018431 [Liparis tanakae]|uniref:Uncharacterized protein n=1 Tax=Liparis tanakae TaxID=230148 RepID=A0A4Z2I288_9TELE|nr:hypothetical protein EYF80_018431 [Liparis tanakae]
MIKSTAPLTDLSKPGGIGRESWSCSPEVANESRQLNVERGAPEEKASLKPPLLFAAHGLRYPWPLLAWLHVCLRLAEHSGLGVQVEQVSELDAASRKMGQWLAITDG